MTDFLVKLTILRFSINHLYDTIERTKQRGNNCEKILSFFFNLHAAVMQFTLSGRSSR